MLISVAAGFLLIIVAVMIFCINRKHKKVNQEGRYDQMRIHLYETIILKSFFVVVVVVVVILTCLSLLFIEIIYSEITFNKREAHNSVRACISVQGFFLVICGGNVYAESKKFKAFIESLSLNRNDTDTDKWRKVCLF